MPLAESVVFAMLASYVLSRTLVPTLANYWLKTHDEAHHAQRGATMAGRFQLGFEHRFEAVRGRYHTIIRGAVNARRVFAPIFLAVCIASLGLVFFIGFDFFPSVDAGQFKMHIRRPRGPARRRYRPNCAIKSRKKSAALFQRIKSTTSSTISAFPIRGLNLSYTSTGVIGPGDADIQVALKEGHDPTADYIRTLRREMPKAFPSVTFSFLPADITSQILNFGLPSPIDVQVRGYKLQGKLRVADRADE